MCRASVNKTAMLRVPLVLVESMVNQGVIHIKISFKDGHAADEEGEKVDANDEQPVSWSGSVSPLQRGYPKYKTLTNQ
jgi:hypothetical protein